MNEHTPGPWEVYEGHDGHFGKMREAYITHDQGTGTARVTIARMIDCGYENAADAALIASAPTLAAHNALLREALERAYAELGDADKLLGETPTRDYHSYDAQARVQTARAIASETLQQTKGEA